MTDFKQICRAPRRINRFSLRQALALSLCIGLFPTAPILAQEKASLSTIAAKSEAPSLLEKGSRFERETSAEASHTYSIALSAGQFVRITIDQRGADVASTLIAPDGTAIIEVDTPNGSKGAEEVLHIAETSGNYRLEVHTNKTDKQTGRYEVRIEELHEASLKDKSRVLSQRAYLAGEQFRLQSNPDAWRKARGKYEEALNYAREAEDRKEEAAMLTYLGGISNYLGDRKAAIDYFSQSIPIFQSLKDALGEASAAGSIGYSYLALNNYDKCLEFYNRSLVLRQSQNDKRGVALSLHNLGSVYSNLREFGKAMDYYNQALEIERAIEDKSLEGSTLNQFGTVHYSLGDFEKAIDYWNQSVAIRDSIGEQSAALMTHNNLASAYGNLGENEKAIGIYKEVIPRAHALHHRETEALALSNLGRSLRTMGNDKEAMEHYEKALELFRATGNKRFELNVLRYIGDSYIALGDFQKASDYMNQSLTISKETFDVMGEANATLGFALIDRKQGNLAEAEKRIDSLIGFFEDRRPSIHVRDLRDSSFAQMQNFFSLKIDLLMQQHKLSSVTGHDREAFETSERGRARSLIEMLRESNANITQGISPDLLARERNLQSTLKTKADALTRLRVGKSPEEKLVAARKEVEDARTELQAAQAQIRATSPRYAALTQPQPLSLAEVQKQALDPQTTLIEYSLGDDRSYMWVVTQTTIKSFELPAEEKIEEAARRVYDTLTARNKVVKFETADEKAARIEAAETEFQSAINSLSAMILAPAATELKTKRIIVVADGALQYIPFGALASSSLQQPSQKGQENAENYCPLILSHEIVSVPSASTLLTMRHEIAGRKPAPKAIAIFADPVFESDDTRVRENMAKAEGGQASLTAVRKRRSPANAVSRAAKDTGTPEDGIEMSRLPFSRKEAQTIASLVPPADSKIALDFEANRKAATDTDLSNYRYIHFATHSLINSRQPELSGIVLSLVDQQGQEQDGFLRAHEIYNLNLPAELVVLSGCQTGLGKQIRGEGIVGITRGFMYAGAARVMVSLWDVDDEATSELMSRFYRLMLGKKQLRPAAALREAQVSMSKDKRWHSPYYWAAFILQGEPN